MDMMELLKLVDDWVRQFRKTLTLEDLYAARNAARRLTDHLDVLIEEHSEYEEHRLYKEDNHA